MERRWYQEPWAIIALLLLFFPVGLYLMWRYAAWDQRAKWAVTGVFAVLIVVAAVSGTVGDGGDGDDESRTVADSTAAEASPTGQPAEAATEFPTPAPTELPTQSPAGVATDVPTEEPTEVPTETPLPSWEDGASITEENVRAALEDADEMIRSENLGNPTRIVAGGGIVIVEYKADSILGETDLLTVAAQTSYSAMRALFMNPLVESVSVNVLADWTDQYGATQEEQTTSANLTRNTVDGRIDWDGLQDLVYGDNKHFFCIADDYYIHPGIYSRLEDKGCLLQ